jgi:hypothetical protein
VRRKLLVALAVTLSVSLGRTSNGDPRWFSSNTIREFQLEAPYDDLFRGARAEPDYEVTGRLSYLDPVSGRRIYVSGVKVATRGGTSRQPGECDFPKLKLAFTEGATAGSIFTGTATLKLGTHCADRPDQQLTEEFGRLANEKAPHREALVYALLDAVEAPTLRARAARMSYVFTDAPASRQAPLVRNVLLLEDDDEAIKRFGATTRLTEDRFDTARSTFKETDVARLAFAEAMVGNFDWCLRFFAGDRYRCDDTHPLWNILGLARDDGSTLPVIYDFDLSGIVVGRHIWFPQVFDESFLPSGSRIEIEVLAQLQRTRSLFGRGLLDETRAAFMRRRNAAYRAVIESVADEEGRALANAYLDAFFTLIAKDATFYQDVIATGSVQAHLDSGGTEPACGDNSAIPVGTPVTAPLAREGEMALVRVLDALWHWTPPQLCDAIHRQPVWVPRSAVTSNYPASGSR